MNRRHFARRAFLAGGGLLVVGHFMPNIFVPKLTAGVAKISDVGGDKVIELSNASFAREFDIGTWTRARVAVRFRFVGGASVTGLTPRFVIGMLSGTANQVLDTTSDNFLGARSKAATWGYNGSVAGYLMSVSANAIGATKRVGSVWTDGGGFTGMQYDYWLIPGAVTNSSAFMLEIARGTPNYTLKAFFQYNTPGYQLARDTLVPQLTLENPALTWHMLSSEITLAFDEVAGALNSVCGAWDRSEMTLQVSDVFVVKMT